MNIIVWNEDPKMKSLHFSRPALLALATSAAVIFASTSAAAQTLDRLAEADANGDGQIAWQEMLDMRAEMFGRLDRNGDGYADSKDAPRIGAAKSRYNEALGKLKSADANGDGRISRTEMLDAPAPLFEQGDINDDKILSADEIAALRSTAATN